MAGASLQAAILGRFCEGRPILDDLLASVSLARLTHFNRPPRHTGQLNGGAARWLNVIRRDSRCREHQTRANQKRRNKHQVKVHLRLPVEV